MAARRAEGVVITDDSELITNAKAISDVAASHRLPSIGFNEIAESGGLMAYGVDFPEFFRKAAVLIDKIFRGAKPGDLPIEKATKFDLIINLKTAKALGIAVPRDLLQRADRVIE